MPYTNENGWAWRERLDGSWTYGNGYVVATVWPNGTWHTWDANGVGGENSEEPTVEQARVAAERSVRLQGFTEGCARAERDRIAKQVRKARKALKRAR